MSLEFTLQEKGDKLELSLQGECNIYSAKILKNIFAECELKTNYLVVNLKSVNEIHTSAIQCFLAIKKKFKLQNKKIQFVEHSLPALELFDLFGLIAKFGDKIHITKELKPNLKLQYGLKKSYEPYS